MDDLKYERFQKILKSENLKEGHGLDRLVLHGIMVKTPGGVYDFSCEEAMLAVLRMRRA